MNHLITSRLISCLFRIRRPQASHLILSSRSTRLATANIS